MSVRDDGKYYTDDSFYADSGAHFTFKDGEDCLYPRKSFGRATPFCLPKDLRTIHRKKHKGIEYRNRQELESE